jgi:hypothetical protein
VKREKEVIGYGSSAERNISKNEQKSTIGRLTMMMMIIIIETVPNMTLLNISLYLMKFYTACYDSYMSIYRSIARDKTQTIEPNKNSQNKV